MCLVFYFGLNTNHIICHDGADGRASCKKKIDHSNLTLIVFLGYCFPVLIGQTEIRNAMAFFDVLQGTVNQFETELSRLVNWKYTNRLEGIVEQDQNANRDQPKHN